MNNDGKSVPLVSENENGTKGVTLLPGNKHDPSPDDAVWIYTGDKLTKEGQAVNTAHEGFGHAILYERQQQGEDVDYNHNYVGTVITETNAEGKVEYAIGRKETNEALGNQIKSSESEAKQNFNNGKDKNP